mmetsp:Transcript_125583/g.390985  ORF Transcript_125583/g.390985 Transcript_125583/m.390985 type:complete len:212 (+) Transcript_125583:772-1407(+)
MLRIACGVVLFMNLCKMSILPNAIMYAELRFGWHPDRTGLLITAVGVGHIVAMLALSISGRGAAEPAQGGNERAIAWLGLLVALLGVALLSVATVGWLLFPGLFLEALSMVTYTSLGSYCGRLTDPSMNGQVQALLGIWLDVSALIGPMSFSATMRWALRHQDWGLFIQNIPFMAAGLMQLISMAFMWKLPSMEDAYRLSSKTRNVRPMLV